MGTLWWMFLYIRDFSPKIKRINEKVNFQGPFTWVRKQWKRRIGARCLGVTEVSNCYWMRQASDGGETYSWIENTISIIMSCQFTSTNKRRRHGSSVQWTLWQRHTLCKYTIMSYPYTVDDGREREREEESDLNAFQNNLWGPWTGLLPFTIH